MLHTPMLGGEGYRRAACSPGILIVAWCAVRSSLNVRPAPWLKKFSPLFFVKKREMLKVNFRHLGPRARCICTRYLRQYWQCCFGETRQLEKEQSHERSAIWTVRREIGQEYDSFWISLLQSLKFKTALTATDKNVFITIRCSHE
eukprot:INCI5773.1.p1 GENE.INCI5773.1~~INCI5773.1.p1  ORF type:complete len:145 (-),score=3.01 INCI5773.1:36-470(-)